MNGTVLVSELDQLSGDSFRVPYKISKVWLSGNSFTSIPANYFTNVSSYLTEVHMNKNSLATLPTGLFANMPLLQTVLLHYGGETKGREVRLANRR